MWRFLVALGRARGGGRLLPGDVHRGAARLPAAAPRRREHNLRAWVLTIAHRKALDAHRARARARRCRSREPRRGRRAPRERTTRSAARDEALWQAVGELPERQRSAVVLRYVGDLPHRDIAAAIGCSEEAARRSLHEGLTKLRKVVPA